MTAGVIAASSSPWAPPAVDGYRDAVLATNPALYLRLDETNGTTAADSSGHARHGTYVHENNLDPGFGLLLGRDGDLPSGDKAIEVRWSADHTIGGWADVPYGAWMNAPSFTISVLARLGLTTDGDATIAARDGAWQLQFMHAGTVHFLITGDTGDLSMFAGSSTPGAWQRLVVSYNNATKHQILYLEGAVVDDTAWGGTPPTPAAPTVGDIIVGALITGAGPESRWYGRLDEFVFWDRVLTPAEVTSLQDASVTPPLGPVMLGSDGLHPNDAGEDHLVAAMLDALSAAGKTPAPGGTIHAFGDSWTASDINNTPGHLAIVQLAADLSMTLSDHAVNGYKAGDIAGRVIGTSFPIPAGTTDLAVVAGAGLNDLQVIDSTLQRTAIYNFLRAAIVGCSASARIEESAFTLAGSWGGVGGSLFSAGALMSTSTDGSTATYNVTTAGTYYYLGAGLAPGVGVTGGIITVTQGATVLATVDIDSQCQATGATIGAFGPLVARLEGVVVGPLTVTFSAAGRSGTPQGYIDALLAVPAAPRTVLVVKPVRVTNGAYLNPSLLTFIRDSYDAIAAELGSHVVVCDPDPGWNPGP